MRRRLFTLALWSCVAVPACGKSGPAAQGAPGASLEHQVKPAAVVAALRAKGGGHYHATAFFRVTAKTTPAPNTVPAAKDAVTTTTDLWLDPAGNFRLVETNDDDGGREVVRVGAEAVVTLRYEKGTRRPMLPAEADAILAEAVGAPFSAWETLETQLHSASAGAGDFLLKRADKATPAPPAATPLRAWRGTIAVSDASGSARLDGGLLTKFDLRGAFTATRDNLPLDGEVNVIASVDSLGAVPAVTLPDVPPMPTRQRTILEEKALLGGLQGLRGSAKSK